VDWAMAARSTAAQDGAAAGALGFLPPGTPAGLGIKPVAEGIARAGETVFKTSHYSARLESAGLNVARAEAKVAEAVDAMRSNLVPEAAVRGRVLVDGVLVEYRAMPLPNGKVNVGTIFPVVP